MRILKTTVNLSAAIIISTALIACSNSETAPDEAKSTGTMQQGENAPDVTTPENNAPENNTANNSAANTAEITAIADMSPIELMDSAALHSNELADSLALVKDEASAETAIAQMKSLGPKMSAAMERLDSLEQNEMALSLKTMKSVQALAEAQMRVFNETARITKDHPELRDTIIEGFENLEIKMP